MNYLSEMLKLPVLDVDGEKLGVVNDFGIATGEVFPHVTSLAFRGPGKTPFMISWRKWVDRIDETGVHLKSPATEIRFSYLQPTELLLARDVLNKQIVDTQGMKVVRVNDIKFSMSGENQLRLLGAEVGARGLLRAISPALEHVVEGFMKHLGKPLGEDIIAWSYMDLLDRSTKNIQLSVSHKTLGELHPADIADIIEQLDPRLRETTDDDPATVKSHEEFTTVYDIIDQLEAALGEAKSSIFAPGMVKVDRDEFTDQLSELKKMLPVQLERASALMREAERRLESAQTQSNAIVASAQSRAANMIRDANEQAQFLAGQENVTELARQKARAILDQAQTKADHLTQGADQYCTTVMEGLSQQLGKLSQDVQAGLNVLEERQRAAREQMPHLTLNDYPEAQ